MTEQSDLRRPTRHDDQPRRGQQPAGAPVENDGALGDASQSDSSARKDKLARAADLLPSVSVPKGGGAIRGLDEKFSVNAPTGTGSMAVKLPLSSGRSGFTPVLQLAYDSSSGNGPVGFGWGLGLPTITRKTDKGLPLYRDSEESDVFILAGSDDLVPVLDPQAGTRLTLTRTVYGTSYQVAMYRPRIEGLFSRIERWTATDTGTSHWRTITRDNVTALYGADPMSAVADPDDPPQDILLVHLPGLGRQGQCRRLPLRGRRQRRESTRPPLTRRTGRRRPAPRRSTSRRSSTGTSSRTSRTGPARQEVPLPADWMFTVVLDYGDHTSVPPTPQPDQPWPLRPGSVLALPRQIRGPDLPPRAAAAVLQQLPRRADGRARLPRPVARPGLLRPADPARSPQPALHVPRLDHPDRLPAGRPGPGHPVRCRRSSSSYSQPQIQQEILTLDPGSQANLPEGLDGGRFRWVDLDGEGLTGILSDVGGSWYYKRNLSAGNLITQADGTLAARASFGPLETVSALPSRSDLSAGPAA